MSPWWVGVIAGGFLIVAGVAFIGLKRGTDVAVGEATVAGIPLKSLSGAFAACVLGALLLWQSITRLDDERNAPERVATGKVSRIQGAPTAPTTVPDGEEGALTYVRWVLRWYDEARIIVDRGAAHGIQPDDVFVVVEDPTSLENIRASQLGNLGDEALGDLRVARVRDNESVAQLESFVYEPVLDRVSDDEELFTEGAPVRVGDSVAAVPAPERILHDQIDRLKEEAEELSGPAKRETLAEIVDRAIEFRDQFPTGYFAAASLFDQGYAQWQLRHCAEVEDTYSRFVALYPFHRSVEGARGYIDRAERCQRRRRS